MRSVAVALAVLPLGATVAIRLLDPAATVAVAPVPALAVARSAAMAPISPPVASRVIVAVPALTAGRARPAIIGAATTGALLHDRFERFLGRQELQQIGAGRLLLWWNDGQHPNALDVVLGLDPQLIADRGSSREDRSVEHATWFTRPGCAPGPRAVGARAGELDLDARRHGQPRYTLVRTRLQ